MARETTQLNGSMRGPPGRAPRRKLTEGPVVPALIAISLPIMFSNMLQTAYQLIDTFWVGRLGSDAVAAVSFSFPIVFLLISLGAGLAIAGSILVAQNAGKGDEERVDYISGQTLAFLALVSIVIGTIGFLVSRPLIALMGAEPSVLPLATAYLRVTFVGIPLLFAYFSFQNLLRGVGEVKLPLYIVAGTVALNAIMDPVFIMGWGPVPAYGVAGAAIATIICQGLAGVIGIALLMTGRFGIHIKAANLRPHWETFKRMIALGFPASIEQGTRAGGILILTFLVGTFGTQVVAAYGIGTRVLSFVIIPALGLSMATSTIVGQNIGAGKPDRARKSAIIASGLGFGVLTLAGVATFVFARPIAHAFITADSSVIDMAATFIRIMSLSFGFIGVQQTLNGVFRGAGRTLASMVLAIVSLWVLRFPLAYVLSKHTALGPTGIWWAFPIANVLAAIIATAWFWQGGWMRGSLVEEDLQRGEAVAETTYEETYD